ncbi:type VI secretion system tip protein VgrG [Algibacter mikhailovii]|uniref:type VI secretion system tip protein VgrG n=1 Tax=Algibacter mikhailovii TaxID=425498 RepID=UPI0024953206|nr:type VI secretion system tip protein VgrG [Algibacter mikhailovii]
MAEILKQADGIIDFDILINGIKIKDTVEVLEIFVEMEVNRITSATIVIQDGGAIGVVGEGFTHSEGKEFIPGCDIEISLGYIDTTKKVFKGIIVSQRLKVKGKVSQLTVKCQDKAINMTQGRFNAFFQNKTDSDAIKSIASKYSLDFEMDATKQEHPVLIQYNCSDWDYIVIRAEANDMLVHTYQNKLSIVKNDFSKEPKYEIKSSQYVIDIDLNLESENISGTYNMSSWDSGTQDIVSISANVNDTLSQGNLSAKKLSDNLSNSSDSFSSASMDKEEMKTWLESKANMAILEKIQGKITVPGNTKIIPGDIIKLSEFSERFNGKAYISKVIHALQDGEWLTELYVGKSAKLHAALPDVEDMGASGLLPALTGTQIAKVKKIYEDPDNNYRVLVTLPTFTGTGQEDGIWARIAFPYASGDAGFFFFPEVDDEVILTFMNNDPRFPVITGAIYNGKNKPKETPDEKNQFKSIYSKSGIHIKFDDKDKILTIATPGNNTIVLDDKNKNVSIKDMNENSIVMDDSGITMNTPKDINLKADGNINLTATSNLAMKATADATLDGLSITHSAQTSFTAKGNASAELSASGQTTVKGAMVMIN